MVTKDEIQELILAKPHKYTVRDLADIFDMKSTECFVELNKMINTLESQFILVRDRNDCYCSAKEAGCFQGKIKVNRRGFGFLDLDDEHSIFVPKDKLNTAMDQDLVIVQTQDNIKNNPEGEVVRILERGTTQIIATYRRQKSLVLVSDDERITQELKVLNQKATRAVEGLKVQCTIKKVSDPMHVEITQVLGHENDPGVDILAVLHSHGIVSDFNKEVLRELEGIHDHVLPEELAGRIDLREETIVTIDGDDSKDLDDAISISRTEQGFKLGVHIADVSHYVKEGSALDIEACRRGTSTYVCDRVVPMLPHYLSNGICSLNEGVERCTLSCEMEFDEYGDVIDYRIFPSVIRSNARMTYRNVNKILANDVEMCHKYASLVEMFQMMQECAIIIRRKRIAYGAIDFDRDEAKIIVDKKGRVTDIKLRERGLSERIIEDFMVSANECVARHAKWLQVPLLYRVHESPSLKKMQNFSKITTILGYRFKGSLQDLHPQQLQHCLLTFKSDESYPVVSSMMLRSMQKARYDRTCTGHFGLGLQEYAHFTSPIRRYPDLIVHRMLRKYCIEACADPQQLKNDELKMEELQETTSDCERRATEAEREVDDMKKAEYMKKHVGETFEAVISSITKFGFYVELDNTVEGLVHIQDLRDDYYHYHEQSLSLMGERSGKIFKLGQRVQVKLIAANKEKREISFVLARTKQKRQKPENRRYERNITSQSTSSKERKAKRDANRQPLSPKERKAQKDANRQHRMKKSKDKRR